MSWRIRQAGTLMAIATVLLGGAPAEAQAPPKKPNILVIQKIKDFFADYEKFPHQEGSSLNAGAINYGMLRHAEAMKRLKEVETMSRPGN
jgi:hypothetical protein